MDTTIVQDHGGLTREPNRGRASIDGQGLVCGDLKASCSDVDAPHIVVCVSRLVRSQLHRHTVNRPGSQRSHSSSCFGKNTLRQLIRLGEARCFHTGMGTRGLERQKWVNANMEINRNDSVTSFKCGIRSQILQPLPTPFYGYIAPQDIPSRITSKR